MKRKRIACYPKPWTLQCAHPHQQPCTAVRPISPWGPGSSRGQQVRAATPFFLLQCYFFSPFGCAGEIRTQLCLDQEPCAFLDLGHLSQAALSAQLSSDADGSGLRSPDPDAEGRGVWARSQQHGRGWPGQAAVAEKPELWGTQHALLPVHALPTGAPTFVRVAFPPVPAHLPGSSLSWWAVDNVWSFVTD